MKTTSHYNNIRFILFAIVPSYLILQYYPLKLDNTHWQPISFYALFSNPINLNHINILKWCAYLFSLLASIGFKFPLTSKVAALTLIFSLGYKYNFGSVHHSTHLYLGSIIILAFAPRGPNKQRDWHINLLKIWVVYTMFLLGVQKITYSRGFDWVFSHNLYNTILRQPTHTTLGKWLLNSNILLSQIFAGFSLFIVELSSPLSLINKRLGIYYFIIWSLFHFSITLFLGGHTKFYTQIFVYCAFLPTPEILKSFTQSVKSTIAIFSTPKT